MKYSSAIAPFLIVIGSLFFGIKISSAQTLSPQLTSQQIPAIDPAIAQEANKYTRSVDLCPPTYNPLIVRCFGKVIAQDTAVPFTTSKPAGFGPAEFRNAYNVSGKATGTPIIAIVDAYNQPNMLSDLQTYSTTFNLPQLANCSGAIASSSVPCFKKVSQTGTTKSPKTDAG